jgi:imidazolonepropionase-like amidohydrolase
MTAWVVRAVELPFGQQERSWRIGASGAVPDHTIGDAELLPGRFMLAGLVDAHAHPALGAGPSGPVALTPDDARANLLDWAQAGVTLVRDAGSPGGLTLGLDRETGMPALEAAGRFLAPAGRYFPELLVTPVAEAELVSAALAEIGRGASWVKLVADFPDLAAGTGPDPTYGLGAIARLAAAVHEAGGRVAAHSTTAFAAELVGAGIDSIEHGTGLDEDAVRSMAGHGTAWTPTLGATLGPAGREPPPERRGAVTELRDRLGYLLPLAVRLGVPVLAGTDVMGSLPGEVALLASLGLSPAEALAAASSWPRTFIGAAARADVVTYEHDPRDDPDQLATPAAVIVGGIRLR